MIFHRSNFLSGYRGLSRVLQNAPSCMPDVLHSISPAFVASQALHVLKRSVEAFGDVRKSVRELKNAER